MDDKAKRFLVALKDEVGEEHFWRGCADIRAMPKTAKWCPFQDYCDANMVMLDELFDGVMPDDVGPEMDAFCTEWGAIWDRAHELVRNFPR